MVAITASAQQCWLGCHKTNNLARITIYREEVIPPSTIVTSRVWACSTHLNILTNLQPRFEASNDIAFYYAVTIGAPMNWSNCPIKIQGRPETGKLPWKELK